MGSQAQAASLGKAPTRRWGRGALAVFARIRSRAAQGRSQASTAYCPGRRCPLQLKKSPPPTSAEKLSVKQVLVFAWYHMLWAQQPVSPPLMQPSLALTSARMAGVHWRPGTKPLEPVRPTRAQVAAAENSPM